MADKLNYTKKIIAEPTHILIPDNPADKERILYANWNGDLFFMDGFMPERGKSYRLVTNTEYEEYVAQYNATK